MKVLKCVLWTGTRTGNVVRHTMDWYIFCRYYEMEVENLAFAILERGDAKDAPDTWATEYRTYKTFVEKVNDVRTKWGFTSDVAYKLSGDIIQEIEDAIACRSIIHNELKAIASRYASDKGLRLSPESELDVWNYFTAMHGIPSAEDERRIWACVDSQFCEQGAVAY